MARAVRLRHPIPTLLLLWSAEALAQGAGPASTPARPAPVAQRIEVEGQSISATEERRQSLLLMTVVGRDELDEYGDTSVLDVLQRLPGLSIEGDQPRLRGLGGGYTQILLNGEPAPPGFSLEQLSPAEIERIEIVKGPSAEFGGVAGTINVILRTPPKLRQRELRVTPVYRAVRPTGSLNLSWGDRVGDIGFQLPLAAYQWVGANRSFSERLSRTADGQQREYQIHGQDQWHGGGVNFGPRLEWKLSEQQTLHWQSFLQRNETGNANQRQWTLLHGAPLSIVDERTRAEGSWELARTQLQWVHKSPEGERIELKASWQDSAGRSHSFYDGLAGPAAPLQREVLAESDEQRTAAGFKLRWPLAAGHVLATGGDAERRQRHELRRVIENGVEQITPSQGVPFGVELRRQVFYAQDEWSASPRLSALVGLRAERLQTQATSVDGAFSNSASVLTPVLQWRLALDAKGRDLIRGSASRSTRLPDLSALMGRYVLNTSYDRNSANTPLAADSAGNPALRPERATAFELAIEQYPSGGGVLSVGVFHRRIEDLIRRRIALETVAEAAVPRWVSRPVNFGRARSSGAEFELKGRGDEWLPWAFAPRSPWNLRAALSVYRSAVEQIDDPDARLEGQPPWQATLGFDRQPRDGIFGFGASLAYTPGYATQQTDRQRVSRNASQRLDAYALWRFSREAQLRVALQSIAPRDMQTTSSVTDLDGFTARSLLVRPVLTQFSASLVLRF